MDTGSILISVLVFLVFYQVIVRFSKKSSSHKVNSSEQMEQLIEKFDRVFKYEINDIARSVAALQNLNATPPQSPEILSRLDRIESAIVSLEGALNPSLKTASMPASPQSSVPPSEPTQAPPQ